MDLKHKIKKIKFYRTDEYYFLVDILSDSQMIVVDDTDNYIYTDNNIPLFIYHPFVQLLWVNIPFLTNQYILTYNKGYISDTFKDVVKEYFDEIYECRIELYY